MDPLYDCTTQSKRAPKWDPNFKNCPSRPGTSGKSLAPTDLVCQANQKLKAYASRVTMFPDLAATLKQECKPGLLAHSQVQALCVESMLKFALTSKDFEMKQKLIRKTLTKIGADLVPETMLLKPLVQSARAVLATGRAPAKAAEAASASSKRK